MSEQWCSVSPWQQKARVVIKSHLSEHDIETESQFYGLYYMPPTAACSNSPLGVEDAVEGGPPPVLARQREHSPEVVERDVALWEGALQSGFLEGGPLLLQGPGTTQIPLCQTY